MKTRGTISTYQIQSFHFFAELFNISKTHLLKDINSDEIDKPDETFDKYGFNQSSSSDKQSKNRHLKSIKIKSMVQILYYNIHSGRKLKAFHVMNSVQIYEACRSKELITSFNRSGLCISYQSMKQHRQNLARLAVQSNTSKVPLPTHFSPEEFSVVAFDNFNHADKNSLSGKYCSNDTAITLFQSIPNEIPRKPKNSEVNLENVKLIEQLPCQKIESYQRKTKALKLQDDFIKTDDTDSSSSIVNDKIETINTVTNLLMISAINSNQNTPSWSGIRSLLSETKIPLMQVGFLSFIPHPVTEYSTVYTPMNNFVSLNVQLK